MSTWQLRVQRYDPAGGESRLSGIRHLNADAFDLAVTRAHDIVAGMAAADPEREYKIAHLLSHDYRGVDCEGGIFDFETREEMRDRLADKASTS